MALQCARTIRQSRLFRRIQNRLEKLEEINLLKDEFLSTVSHELRTPMTNLKMSLNMLANSLELGHVLSNPDTNNNKELSSVERYLKISYDECQREIQLIEDLLALQKLENGCQNLNLEEIYLQDCINTLIEPFQIRASNLKLNLIVNISPDLPPLISNQISLERIISELLNNACKYTPPGENIDVSACVSTKTELKLIVSNSGIKIPQKNYIKYLISW